MNFKNNIFQLIFFYQTHLRVLLTNVLKTLIKNQTNKKYGYGDMLVILNIIFS